MSVNPAPDNARLQDLIQTSKLALLGQLAAGIAHELRNPLAVLRIESDEIARAIAELPDEQRRACAEHCDVLNRNIAKMAGIIDRIRSMSINPSTGFMRLNLREVLAEVEHWSSRLLDPMGIRILFLDEAEDPYFYGSKSQMEDVFLNLIRNAADAIRSSGRGSAIRLTTQSDTEQVYIDVEDDGPGIAPDNLPLIFDPFFTTKPEGEGMGLGLSIVAEMVKGHGGTIDVVSHPGRGTAFRIALPHDRRLVSRRPA